MPSPDKFFSFKGYRWAEVNYDGCFFRAKGKGANPFNGEEQGDAIRNIAGTFGAQGSSDARAVATGAFSVAKRSHIDSGFSERSDYSVVQDFSADKVVPTANENRPRNKTFIIWQLKKI